MVLFGRNFTFLIEFQAEAREVRGDILNNSLLTGGRVKSSPILRNSSGFLGPLRGHMPMKDGFYSYSVECMN